MPNNDPAHLEGLRPIYNQTRIEHAMLSHAREALIVAIEWQTIGETFTRKLATLRYAWMAYQQHVERVLAIEECDGYMNFVLEESPHLSGEVNRLRSQHDEFREEMHGISTKLERLMPTDHVALQAIVQQVVDLLRRFADHSQREISLLQSAMNDELGAVD